MKKRPLLIILLGVAMTSSSAITWKVAKKTTPTSLYAKNQNGTGACFAVCSGSVSANLDTNNGLFDFHAKIRSASGTLYKLFENADCTNDVIFL